MALMDESVWRGNMDLDRAVPAGIGASGARFGGVANLEAFTDARWVTVRGDIAPYPF